MITCLLYIRRNKKWIKRHVDLSVLLGQYLHVVYHGVLTMDFGGRYFTFCVVGFT